MDGRQYFDVDPSVKDEFKAAAGGKARWDSVRKRWYMSDDDVRRAPDKNALAQWRPPHVSWPVGDADTNLTISAVPHECLKCSMSSLALVGFTIDGDPEFDGIVVDATAGPTLKLLADALTEVDPASIHRYTELAHFRRRGSKTREEVYFANCCRDLECDSIFGAFYLHRKLVSADANGSLIRIGQVRAPRYLLDEAMSDFEDD